MDTPLPFEKSLTPDARRLVEACVRKPDYLSKLRRLFGWIAWDEDRRIDLERLKSLGQADLNAFAEAAELSSPYAFNSYASALRKLGRTAQSDHGTLLPGLFRLENRKTVEEAYSVLTPEQARALIDWPEEPDRPTAARNSAIYALIYGLGLLPTQIVALNREDYESAPDAQIRVGGSNGRRMLPVLPIVARLIDHHLDNWPELRPQDPLFPDVGGGRFDPSGGAFYRELSRRSAALGIPFPVRPMELREAFKAHMLAAGAPHRVLKDILGVTTLDKADLIGRRASSGQKADES